MTKTNKNTQEMNVREARDVMYDGAGNIVNMENDHMTSEDVSEIIKSFNEANLIVPEIIINANRYKIEKAVEFLTLFYSPVASEQAAAELQKIKNLGAQMEFKEENDNEAFAESLCIYDNLSGYMDRSHYFTLVSGANIGRNKELLLVNAWIVYDNAKSLMFRTRYTEYEDAVQEKLARTIAYWAEAVMDAVKAILEFIGENERSDKACEEILRKVYGLNGSVIQFCEMGF